MNRLVAALFALPGIGLIGLAARATPAFIDRHIRLPNWFVPPPMWLFTSLRILALLFGLLVVMLAFKALRFAIAILLAFLAAGFILRTKHQLTNFKLETTLCEADPVLGWKLKPHRSTVVNGITYAIDANGHRASSPDFVAESDKPTIVLAGESVAFGYGLQWPETIGGRLAELTKAQVIVTAVGGYSNVQAEEAAAAARGAKVTIILPAQIGRNLNKTIPYLSDDDIERSLKLLPKDGLLVEPIFSDEPLLKDVNRLAVPLSRAQTIEGDGHPNAEGALVIARAIAHALGYR